MSDDPNTPPAAGHWRVVANVVRKRLLPDGTAAEGGTRHFRAGARVAVAGPPWGDGGERLPVRAVSRSGRTIEIVLSPRHLENFRAGFFPGPPRDHRDYATRAEAEAVARRYNEQRALEDVNRMARAARERERGSGGDDAPPSTP